MYFKLLFEYFNEYPYQFVFLIIARLILYFFEIVVLSYLASCLSFAVKKNSQNFLRTLFTFIGFFVFTSFLWFCVEAYNSYIIPSIQEFVRKKILDSVLDHNFSYENQKIGETLNNLSRIPHLIYVQMISFSYYIMPFIFTFFFLFIYFFRFGWQIGASFTIIMICFFIIYGIWFHRNIQISMKRYKDELNLSEKFDDILINSEQILNNNQKDEAINNINAETKMYNTSLQKELMAMNLWKQTLDGSLIIVMGLIIWLGYYLYQNKLLTPIKFASLVTLIIFIINRVISLINRIGDIPYVIGGIVVSNESMDNKKKKKSIHGTEKNFIKNKKISIRNLDFGYSSHPILKNICMEIPFLSNHLISGESGSGKTTLCRCIMGYYKVPDNTIFIDDKPIEKIDIGYLRAHLNIMTQNGFLFDKMVWENISKNPDDIEKLTELPIYPKIENLLNRRAGKMGSNLSGGERQIVLLLRSYLRDSFFIILDEPTSNIDPNNKKIIFEIIKSICKKKSVLCITHDKELYPYFDNIHILKNGTLHRHHASEHTSLGSNK